MNAIHEHHPYCRLESAKHYQFEMLQVWWDKKTQGRMEYPRPGVAVRVIRSERKAIEDRQALSIGGYGGGRTRGNCAS